MIDNGRKDKRIKYKRETSAFLSQTAAINVKAGDFSTKSRRCGQDFGILFVFPALVLLLFAWENIEKEEDEEKEITLFHPRARGDIPWTLRVRLYAIVFNPEDNWLIEILNDTPNAGQAPGSDCLANWRPSVVTAVPTQSGGRIGVKKTTDSSLATRVFALKTPQSRPLKTLKDKIMK